MVTSGTATGRSTSWKFYIVSALIVLTFTFLYVIPLAIINFIRWDPSPMTKRKLMIHEGLYLIANIGIMSDAIIYVFLKKEFLNILFRMFSLCKQNAVTLRDRLQNIA